MFPSPQLKEREKIEAHVSASSNPSYAKSAVLCGTRTFRSSTIFFLSYGHWCPDKEGFTVDRIPRYMCV